MLQVIPHNEREERHLPLSEMSKQKKEKRQYILRTYKTYRNSSNKQNKHNRGFEWIMKKQFLLSVTEISYCTLS